MSKGLISSRILGIFRICLGIYLIYDLVARWLNRSLLYHPILLGGASGDLNFSLFRATANSQTLPLLWAFLLACYLGFAIGFRTRIFHAASLIGFCSLVNYNFRATYEGDAMVAFLLFWTLFLRLDGFLSVDGKRQEARPPDFQTGWAVTALKGQVIVVYLVSGLWKITNPDKDWFKGSAFYFGSRYDCTAWGLSGWIQHVPFALTQLMTWASFGIWLATPFLWIFSGATSLKRRNIFIAAAINHLLLCVTLYPMDSFWPLLLMNLLFLFPEDLGLASNQDPRRASSSSAACSKTQKGLVAAAAYVLFFALIQNYEPVTIQPLGSAITGIYYALKPVRLVNLANAVFPPQYWRFHSFTPRYDTAFVFEGISAEGKSISLMDPFVSQTAWRNRVAPEAPSFEPNRTGRKYHRLVYNFLWYHKKGGSPGDLQALGNWLKFKYESKFPGLKLKEIRWHSVVDITVLPGETPPPVTQELFHTWHFTG